MSEISERNNSFAWMVCDYLDKCPDAIDKELLKMVDPDGSMDEGLLYSVVFEQICRQNDDDLSAGEIEDDGMDIYFRNCVKRLDASLYKANPYLTTIQFPRVRRKEWEMTQFRYKPYEAFIRDDIRLIGEVEIPQVGYFDEEFRYPVVTQDGREWMAVKPSEIESMAPVVEAVCGNVVTFGLGLGYFAFMASRKSGVDSVTVVERDPSVISLFEEFILPQFPDPSKVNIVKSDAFEFMKTMSGYDHAFVDLWHDTADGVESYKKARALAALSPATKWHYWVEKSLRSAIKWQSEHED